MNKNLKKTFKNTSQHIKLLHDNRDKNALEFTNLTISLPDHSAVLIDNFSASIKQGDKIAFTGPNGAGKSSLFRTIMGLWNFGTGNIHFSAKNNNILCASQSSRMPDTTLEGILSYPQKDDTYSKETYENILKEVELEALTKQLPWNFVKTENLLQILDHAIQNGASHIAKEISENQIGAFSKGFEKFLNKYFETPALLKKHIPDKKKDFLLYQLSKRFEIHLKQEIENGEKSETSFLPRRKGKKYAKKFAQIASGEISKSLLRGDNITLSGGEQQKLIFARILLHKPDILFLDEVTSALKEETANTLYKKMVDSLPESIIISIIHNKHLLPFHTHHMNLKNKKISLSPTSAKAPLAKIHRPDYL